MNIVQYLSAWNIPPPLIIELAQIGFQGLGFAYYQRKPVLYSKAVAELDLDLTLNIDMPQSATIGWWRYGLASQHTVRYT